MWIFFSVALRPNADHGLLILEVSWSHTTTHHSLQDSSGWVISSSQRRLPNNTQHSQQTSMPPVGFEPTISAGERPQTYALDCAATGTGKCGIRGRIIKFANSPPCACCDSTGQNLSMVWWLWHISVSQLCCWSIAVSFWVASIIVCVCFGVPPRECRSLN